MRKIGPEILGLVVIGAFVLLVVGCAATGIIMGL